MKKLLFALLCASCPVAALAQVPQVVTGCVYNSSAPTVANLQSISLQCDDNGNLKIAGSAITGNVRVDQTTPGTTNGVALVGVNAATALAGAGAVGSGSARVAVGQDQTTTAGATPGRTYNALAASTGATALTGGGGGAVGDYLAFCTVIPTTTSPGVVTIADNATAIAAFPGGASSLSNLVPFTIPVGAVSVSGAWKVTTGAGLSVVCVGKFT